MIHTRFRIIALIAFLLISTLILPTIASADAIEGEVISLGGDLSDAQKTEVLKLMGLEGRAITALTVTIDEEKAMLGKWVPAEKIGSRSISSAYVKRASTGAGVSVVTYNIDWCTPAMYASAVTTAGIADAEIIVAAPFNVSGTAALTGILKAYEGAVGVTLSAEAKEVAGEELVKTGELAEFLGSDEAAGLMAELKKQIAENNLTDSETIRATIIQVSNDFNITLTEEQITSLIALLQKIAQLDLDPAKLGEQLKSFEDTLNKLNETQKKAEGLMASFQAFFQKIIDWFGSLFKSK